MKSVVTEVLWVLCAGALWFAGVAVLALSAVVLLRIVEWGLGY